MSNGKNSNQPNQGQSNRPNAGGREQVQAAGEQLRQGAEQATNRIREGYDSARESALHGYRKAEGTVARNPASSVLIGFGVGFGLGLVLTSLFTQQREETWAEKYLPESLQDVPDRYKKVVKNLKQYAPDSDQYQSLVKSLRNVPDSVLSSLPHSIRRHLG